MATKKKFYQTRLDKAFEERANSVYVVEVDGKKVNDTRNNNYPLNRINNTLNSNFAPIKTVQSTPKKKKKEEDKKWYQKIVDTGAFSDGYDFGDVTKTILGTGTNIVTDIVKAPVRIGEGLGDAIGYGAAFALDKMGKDEKADEIRGKASQNLTDKWFSGVDKWTDKTSVLGETTDAILEGVGYVGSIVATSGLGTAAGLGAGGTTALTTGLTATSGFGSGTSEAYQMGATDEEAYKYGIISGAAESLSELLFGGLGKGARAVGISKGIGGIDDILITKATKNIDNILARNLVQGTLKASGEGLEEVIAGTVQALGKKATYMSEEDLMQILEDEKLLEQFIIGGITSSLVQTKGVVDTTKQGRDFVTGYTNNEQTVINKEVESRIKEREQDGTKLNNKEKAKIEERVRNDLEKGYISTDRIESVLGGEEYNTYKSVLDKQNRYNELLDKNVGETTNREKAELDALTKELEQTDINTLKSNLDNSIRQKISSDGLLQRSYQEKANKGVQYQADLTKYDAKQQKTIQKAIDSGILNNTNKTHEFIDMIAKISADKDIDFDFTNNENLKNSGFAVEGKTVNGFINENGITLNMDSNKALNKVVGHEITHVLEGTELYVELQEIVKQYATTKGEYDTRLNNLKELYKNVDNANVENELTADLIGDYLFTDTDFVNNLSTTKPNVFKKIYNEIKHLYKLATAGSKEARELERVKKAFDKAYKENVTSKATNDTKFSLIGNHANKTYVQAANETKAKLMKEQGYSDKTIWLATGYQYNNGMWQTEVSDARFKKGQILEEGKEYRLGDVLDAEEIFRAYPQLRDAKVSKKDFTTLAENENELEIVKDLKGCTTDEGNILITNTVKNKVIAEEILNHEIQHLIQEIEGIETEGANYLYKNENGEYEKSTEAIEEYKKNPAEIEARQVQNRTNMSEEDRKNILPKETTNQVDKTRYSLSEEQQTYFKNSKLRDENGNLEVVYHSTPNEFTVFDNSMRGENTGYDNTGFGMFVTTNKAFSERFKDIDNQGINGYTMELYANVTNPIIHPYKAALKYGEEQANKIVEDYLIATNNEMFLEEIKEYVEEDEYDSVYDAYMNMTLGEDPFGTAEYERDYLEANGYDAVEIIEGYEYELVEGSKNDEIVSSYAIFNSNQLKNADNTKPTSDDDIRMSLSNHGEQIAPSTNDVFGRDIKLQEVIAPLQEEMQTLTESVNELKEQIAPVKQTEEYRGTTYDDLPMFEQQYREAPLNDIAPPEIEQDLYYSPSHISMDNKAITMLSQNMRKALNLNNRQVSALKNIIQNFSLKGNATREQLYDAINNEFGTTRYTETDAYLKDVKDYIRNTAIQVSDTVKSDIADFNYFRQSHYGNMKIRKQGQGIDSVYQELNSLYPDLFPSDIINPTDQLLKISEVADMDEKNTREYVLPQEEVQEVTDYIYESIQDYKYDALRKNAEKQTRLKIDDSMIPYEENVDSKETKPLTETKETINKEDAKMTVKEQNAIKLGNYEKAAKNLEIQKAESYKSFNELIKAKVNEYADLSNKNTQRANNLRQQIENLKLRRDNINADYQRRIEYTNERIEKMNSKEFKTAEQRITKQDEYRELARDLIGDTSTWQDKKLGIQYQINTFKRNLRDIVRGADGRADIQTADAIYEEYQGKYNKNEAKLKVEYDNIIDPYRELNLTKEEHTYTQMLGELKYNPHTTLRQDIVEDYYNRHKNKIDADKVNRTIDAARKTYDDLFNRINEVLKEQGMKEMEYRKGYFPHFTEDKQSFLAKIFDWKIHKTEIPTDVAGLTELYNPERSWQSFNKQRQSDVTDYNFGKGLETYVKGALDWIYHIEDIQKRRALENEIRYQHSEKGIKDKIEKIYENTELDADEVQSQINAVLDNANNPLNNFVTDLRNSTNNLAGKKSSADRGMEYATNRRIYSTMTNISNRVSGNMVGGSLSSAFTNFIPITQSWGEVSPLSSLKASKEVIKNAIRDDGTIAKSTFLTNRFRKTDNLYKTGWDIARDKVGIMTDIIDSFTSQVVWRSKYSENIKNGMSEYAAIENADQFAENVMAGRSRGNQPTIFNSKNPMTKMLTAFQLEVANQYGYMFKDMPTDVGNNSKAKLVKGYATMFVGAYIYNALYSSLTGRDAAFDPIGIIEDILKELGFGGDDDEEEKSASEKFTAISEDLIQDIPFIGGLLGGGRVPISSAIPYENPVQMFTGTISDLLDATDEEKREKSLKDLTSEWLKPVTYLALPFGGGQISKSIKGLSMYDDDLPVAGSYTNGGDLRFTADESLGGKAKSFLFGQYASKSAQEYVDSGFKSIKANNVEELVDLGMTSTEYRKYRNGLKNAGTKNEDKLDYINSLDLPISDKNIMANNVLDRKYEVDMSNYTTYDEFDFSYRSPEKYEWLTNNNISYSEYAASDESKEVYNWAYNNPESYTVSKAVTDDLMTYKEYKDAIYDIEADKDSKGDSIRGSRKEKIISYVNSLDLSIPQKAILIRKEYSTFSQYNRTIVEYVRDLDISDEEKVTILEELDMKVDSKGNVTWD